MSVPAFKNSRSKVRRRRSHHGLKPVAIVIDKKTGLPRLPHHYPEAVVEKDLATTIAKASAKKERAADSVLKAEKKTMAVGASKKSLKAGPVKKAGRKK